MGVEPLESPYYFHDGTDLPGVDFSRQLVPPGTNEEWPDGAVGIYVDDDFWCVAALPWRCRDTPLEDVVAELWPGLAADAQFCPDHGTHEQQAYFARIAAFHDRRMIRHLSEENGELRKQINFLRGGGVGLREFHPSRKSAENGYFIRKNQHLATAMAHEFVPREEDERKGVCSLCGLLGTDQVHSRHYLDLKARGYASAMRHLLDYDDESEDYLVGRV